MTILLIKIALHHHKCDEQRDGNAEKSENNRCDALDANRNGGWRLIPDQNTNQKPDCGCRKCDGQLCEILIPLRMWFEVPAILYKMFGIEVVTVVFLKTKKSA